MEADMMTLLATLLGFISSMFPDLLKLWKDGADRKHELEILKLQLEQQKQGHVNRLEEIQIAADSFESKALYKTYSIGIKWVDALNGTVRPVLAYSFFMLYAAVKYAQITILLGSISIMDAFGLIWHSEDQTIFAGIISFYFGQRAMGKLR
jgi:hypothetical protein